MNPKCKELLEKFKSQENDIAENVIFIVDDKVLQKVAVAWQNTRVAMAESLSNEPNTKDDWDYLWCFCCYKEQQFIDMTGLKKDDAKKHMNHLKELRLIYPDGSINSMARNIIGGMIRQSIAKLTGSKPTTQPRQNEKKQDENK